MAAKSIIVVILGRETEQQDRDDGSNGNYIFLQHGTEDRAGGSY